MEINESSSESNNNIGNQVDTYEKIDQPVALYLFFGRSRAKKIIAEETAKIENGTFVKPKYGNIVRQHITSQIRNLQQANLFTEGWRKLLEDKDTSNCINECQRMQIRNKASYLSMLYHLSLQMYNTTTEFGTIVDAAIEKVNATRLLEYLPMSHHHCKNNSIIQRRRTLYNCFRTFRDNDCFPNPNSHMAKSLPPLLNANPDLVEDIMRFCRVNLDTLSSESLHHFLLTEGLPNIAKTIQEEQNLENSISVETLMHSFGLKKLHLITVQRWMKKLGFQYQPLRKSYYVDNHESEENVRYRNEFLERYFEYELLTHRWYCISDDKRNEMIEQGEIGESLGYAFEKEGHKMWEFHVDDHHSFQSACNHLPYGGFLSVRKPVNKKKAMILGQDEVIMKQFLLSLFYWTLPDGSRPLVPKDEGSGVMVSGFTCRELGFGYKVSDEILDIVNTLRENQKYSDEEAAYTIYGNAIKRKLTSTPFVEELEYGQNKDGYWTYDRMILQLEDCIDVLKVLFPDFDFIFLFDHSNGHDRLQSDGLSITKINVGYGGSQPMMKPSKLPSSCFGPFHDDSYALQPGDTQYMQYSAVDAGPCNMDEKEREESRYDKSYGETRSKDILVQDLITALKQVGVANPPKNKKKLQKLATLHNLPIKYEQRIIDEGWVGKAKGALQVLYERGWIDPENIGKYTWKGTKDGAYSLHDLMKKQEDFMNEKTLLMLHGEKLGVTIDRTPKCHPEIAGEGIEYGWAFSKLKYRGSSIALKRTKESFRDLVRLCIGDTVLTVHKMRKCSKKAREYMLLYRALKEIDIDNIGGSEMGTIMNKHSIMESTIKLFRQLKSGKKNHRSVLENQKADIQSMLQDDMNNVDTKEGIVKCLVKKMATL